MSENSGGILPLFYGLIKAKNAFEGALGEYRKDENNGKGYEMELIETGVAEFMERYGIKDIDNIEQLLPSKYQQIFRIFRSVPWDRTVDLLSVALKEFGKQKDGEYKRTEDVIKYSIEHILKKKIKDAVDDFG